MWRMKRYRLSHTQSEKRQMNSRWERRDPREGKIGLYIQNQEGWTFHIEAIESHKMQKAGTKNTQRLGSLQGDVWLTVFRGVGAAARRPTLLDCFLFSLLKCSHNTFAIGMNTGLIEMSHKRKLPSHQKANLSPSAVLSGQAGKVQPSLWEAV